MSIKDNLTNIQQALGVARLVAVTKYASLEQIQELIAAGQKVLGESRVQDAQKKAEILKEQNIEWHMVGHLQTNKVKQAIKIFEYIQSVDSLRLAQEIDKEAKKINKVQKILVQINIGREPQKTGILPEETENLIKEVTGLTNLQICGLMAIAPYFDNSEKARPYFKEMKKIFDTFPGLTYLSMGMSQDYQIALTEGSNMVRIGSALFA